MPGLKQWSRSSEECDFCWVHCIKQNTAINKKTEKNKTLPMLWDVLVRTNLWISRTDGLLLLM